MSQALAIIKQPVTPVIIQPDEDKKYQSRHKKAGHEILYPDGKHI
jgi:hypothetical protein